MNRDSATRRAGRWGVRSNVGVLCSQGVGHGLPAEIESSVKARFVGTGGPDRNRAFQRREAVPVALDQWVGTANAIGWRVEATYWLLMGWHGLPLVGAGVLRGSGHLDKML